MTGLGGWEKKGNGVVAGRALVIPPIAKGEMDGAPGRFWTVKRDRQKQRQPQQQKQMRGFFAPLRMTRNRSAQSDKK
jgi:hypothetical protein